MKKLINKKVVEYVAKGNFHYKDCAFINCDEGVCNCPSKRILKKQFIEQNKKIECGVMDHDFKHLKRFGRCDWRCPKCGENVMLLLVYAYEAGIDLTKE